MSEGKGSGFSSCSSRVFSFFQFPPFPFLSFRRWRFVSRVFLSPYPSRFSFLILILILVPYPHPHLRIRISKARCTGYTNRNRGQPRLQERRNPRIEAGLVDHLRAYPSLYSSTVLSPSCLHALRLSRNKGLKPVCYLHDLSAP